MIQNKAVWDLVEWDDPIDPTLRERLIPLSATKSACAKSI